MDGPVGRAEDSRSVRGVGHRLFGRSLVEVVGGDVEGGGEVVEGPEVVGVDGGAVAFADLEGTFDEEEGFGGDGEAVVFEGFFRDEDVGDSGFVFEGDEAVAFGGLGALTTNDHAGDLEVGAVGEVVELVGCFEILNVQG